MKACAEGTETCAAQSGGQHCICWWDGGACCGCGEPPASAAPVQVFYSPEDRQELADLWAAAVGGKDKP